MKLQAIFRTAIAAATLAASRPMSGARRPFSAAMGTAEDYNLTSPIFETSVGVTKLSSPSVNETSTAGDGNSTISLGSTTTPLNTTATALNSTTTPLNSTATALNSTTTTLNSTTTALNLTENAFECLESNRQRYLPRMSFQFKGYCEEEFGQCFLRALRKHYTIAINWQCWERDDGWWQADYTHFHSYVVAKEAFNEALTEVIGRQTDCE